MAIDLKYNKNIHVIDLAYKLVTWRSGRKI